MKKQRTTGDSRTTILNTLDFLVEGNYTPALGMAIAANMKVLNDSLQVELNVMKMHFLAKKEGCDTIKLAAMGTLVLEGEPVPAKLEDFTVNSPK